MWVDAPSVEAGRKETDRRICIEVRCRELVMQFPLAFWRQDDNMGRDVHVVAPHTSKRYRDVVQQ